MGTDGSAYTVESFNNVVLDEGVILTVANASIQLVQPCCRIYRRYSAHLQPQRACPEEYHGHSRAR